MITIPVKKTTASLQPSSQPSLQPSSQPSLQPSSQPSLQPSLQPSFQCSAPGSSCLDWRTVMALGLSEADAKAVVKTLAIRQAIKIYRFRLLQTGLVNDVAMKLAKAIAYYDTFGRFCTPQQRRLVRYYSVEICRAQLWRTKMLG